MDSAMEEEDEFPNADDIVWKEEVNVSQLCRVCANPNEFLIPIFYGEGIEQNLSAKISKHLPIKVTEDDKLPTQLCYQCASTLIAWHDMVVGCLEADEKLKVLIGVEDTEISNEVSADKIGEFESQRLSPDKNRTAVVPSESVRRSGSFGVHKDSAVLAQETSLHNEFEPNGTMSNLVEEASEETSESRSDSEEEGCDGDNIYSHVNGKLNSDLNMEDSMSEDSDSDEEEFKTMYSCTTCSASNMTVKEFRRHSQTHTKLEKEGFKLQPNHESSVPLYICIVCGQGNLMLKNLKEHGSLHPKFGKSHFCNLCQRQLPNSKILRSHLDIHLDRNDLFCQFCNRKFNNLEDLESHENGHFSSELLCTFCRENFSSKELMKEHFKEIHAEGTVCQICDHDYKSENLIDKHFMTHTAATEVKRIVKWFSCEVCEKTYDSKISLQRHSLFVHNDRMPLICDICGFACYHLDSLKEHSEMEHKNKMYTCGACNLIFDDKSEFDCHMESHTKKKYTCKNCGTGFTQFPKLKRHLKEHSELDNIHSLDFTVLSSFLVDATTDVLQHNPLEKKFTFTCLECDENFDDQDTYDEHLQSHATYNFICDLCGKSFDNEADLDDHLNKVHSNKFLKTELEGDIRGLPFRCNYCEASFRLEFELDEHVKVHVAVYQCQLCFEEFCDEYEFDSHTLDCHPEEVSEKEQENGEELEEEYIEDIEEEEGFESSGQEEEVDVEEEGDVRSEEGEVAVGDKLPD